MNKNTTYMLLNGCALSLACGLVLLASGMTLAADAPAFQIGKTLTTSQKAAISAKTVAVGAQKFRVLASVSGPEPVSTVANDRDVIGRSRNEVVISELPTDQAAAVVAKAGLTTVSTNYYAHMKISVLRFPSFALAAAAKDQLAKALPAGAKLSIPIQFSEIAAH